MTYQPRPSDFDFVVHANTEGSTAAAVSLLKEQGVVVLRNVHNAEKFSNFAARVRETLKSPAVLGSLGYFQKDPHKVIVELTQFGAPLLQMILDDRILAVAKGYLGDIRLQEAFVKHDLGDGELYFLYHAHGSEGAKDKNVVPRSVGFVHYLHDTSTGAFMYSPGTHKWNTPHGGDPHDYPAEMQRDIASRVTRIDGKMGDVVMFDHRGFHGPEQPVSVSRTVVLGGFHAMAAYGNMVKAPFPVFPHDLTDLSDEQRRVFGLGSDSSLYKPGNMHVYSFSRSNPLLSKAVTAVIKSGFALDLIRYRTKALLRRK